MVKNFTLLLGVILLVVGIAGAASGSHDHNLMVFGINMNHNLVHIVSGALALLAAVAGKARIFCLAFGAVYGLTAAAGFLNMEQAVRFLNLNQADNWLHAAIAASCLFFGLKADKP